MGDSGFASVIGDRPGGRDRAAAISQRHSLQNVGINFDPANMILYDAGDPIEAINILGRHIGHVHVKDAVASDQPGVEWGTEVPFGTGQVDVKKFLAARRAKSAIRAN